MVSIKLGQRGFTLIELLVVISIVGLLSSVVLAVVSSARDKARLAASKKFTSSLYHAYGADAIALYDFEEGGTGPAYDSVDRKYTLNLNGSVSRSITTPNGSSQSISFPGTDSDFLDTNTNIPYGSTWTWSMWVMARSGTGIFFNPGGGGTYLRFLTSGFRFSINGTSMTRTTCSGVTQCLMDETGSRSYGTWYNVAVTHTNLGSNTGITVIYVDGKEVKRDVNYDSTLGTSRLYLGKIAVNGYPFDGLLDDVRLYSQSLVATDIRKIYEDGLASHGPVENSLVVNQN